MKEYLVGTYHPFEIIVIDKISKVSVWGQSQSNIGSDKTEAKIVHNQRMVGYLETLNLNGCLSSKFKDQLKKYKKDLYILSEKYPEKLL